MDFALPPDDDPRRQSVRSWLAAHHSPSQRELAEAGYVAPHWPEPWGLAADPIHQLIIDEELERAGVGRPEPSIGIGWAGPTLIHGGTALQQQRYLPPMLAGEERWCQLFSEPGAGSDLASLSTRAIRDDDDYVLTGQKIWSSYADWSDLGILIARTDPDVPKHSGISYFICPMDTSGITVRPITEMTGEHHFNEVFLDEVRIPAANLVGRENEGWALTKVMLANERVSLTHGGVCWGLGPTADEFFDVLRAHGGVAEPTLRQRAAAIWIEKEVLRLLDLRVLSSMVAGEAPGPEASVKKILSDEHGQRLMELAKDLAGVTCVTWTRQGPLRADGSGPKALVRVERPQRSEDERP